MNMDRFVVREPRVGVEYPQGNSMSPFPGNLENNTAFDNNTTSNNFSPTECFYYGPGPYVAEFQNVRRVNTGVFNVPHNMTAAQMGQARNTQANLMPSPNQMSGIDPRYLAGYTDNVQYILAGQQTQRNPTPIISSFGNEYQNRSFTGPDRNKIKDFTPQVMNLEAPRVEAMPKPPVACYDTKNIGNKDAVQCKTVSTKKPNELDLLKNDGQNQLFTRTEKLKALNKSGPRAFSGPVEKVLKWHKSLQDIGVLILYEIVAKCVNIRSGESCSKNLVIRDESGPAMQVVYYEIDFLLPELKPPCTVRVIGRMLAGTCRLQAFNIRPATGDDVAMLPRRAAVAAHHVAKLCKEYGRNA